MDEYLRANYDKEFTIKVFEKVYIQCSTIALDQVLFYDKRKILQKYIEESNIKKIQLDV